MHNKGWQKNLNEIKIRIYVSTLPRYQIKTSSQISTVYDKTHIQRHSMRPAFNFLGGTSTNDLWIHKPPTTGFKYWLECIILRASQVKNESHQRAERLFTHRVEDMQLNKYTPHYAPLCTPFRATELCGTPLSLSMFSYMPDSLTEAGDYYSGPVKVRMWRLK